MDITLIPVEVVTGIMPLSSPEARSFKPKAWGIEGPVISASRIAVLYPCFCICTAKREVTKDLPTPPLPLTTAMTCFTCVPSCGSAKRL